MSLKTKLHNLIKSQGYISLQQLEQFCHNEHYKLATAERTLRPSISPEVVGVWNKGRTAIIGYSWGMPKKPIDACCYDMANFGQHFGKCKNAPQPLKPQGALL